jgi:hypothetical protein
VSNEFVCRLYTVSAIFEIQVLDSQQRELCLQLLFHFKVAQLTVAISPDASEQPSTVMSVLGSWQGELGRVRVSLSVFYSITR